MNTKFKINRQVVLTISVLLTAMWLPLTTFAQDLTKSCDLAQSANTQIASNSRVHEERVGFAETDPTDQQSRDVGTNPHAFNNRVRQIDVGFSETDPTGQESLNSIVILRPFNHWVQQVNGGFSETDPAVDIPQSFGEIDNQTLVGCRRGHVEAISLQTLKFPSQIDKGHRHEHC